MSQNQHHCPALNEDEIENRLKEELPHWVYENGWIRRKIKTSGWKATLMVVNTVGHLAEKAWHHPDLTVSYAFVIVKLVTHDAKGVTEKDFALAKKIEEVVMWDAAQDTHGLNTVNKYFAFFALLRIALISA